MDVFLIFALWASHIHKEDADSLKSLKTHLVGTTGSGGVLIAV